MYLIQTLIIKCIIYEIQNFECSVDLTVKGHPRSNLIM